jgi:hypothetical protein
MDFDVFTEIVFVEKMETLTCFCNSRICRALSLNEILMIVPLIKKMMSSSVSQVADIDALIALFDKNDGSENDYLEKFTMAYICANNELNRMRLETI